MKQKISHWRKNPLCRLPNSWLSGTNTNCGIHRQESGRGGKGTRREDLRLLVGRGRFIDDLTLPGVKHAPILRSPHAHARIRGIDRSVALDLEGVRGVLTGKDVERMSRPFVVGVSPPSA